MIEPKSGRNVGVMSTSCGPSFLICSSMLARPSRFVSCVVTSTTDFSISRLCNGDDTSTANTTSAPICLATSTGRFIDTPPSTSNWPSIATGVSAAGIDMLARSERGRSPEPSTTGLPVARSVAIARNGTARSSKLCTCEARSVSREITMSKTWPCTKPAGN